MIVEKMTRRMDAMRRTIRKWIWLRRHGPASQHRGIFILGAQRSGTTMLASCFENSPEFDVYGEMSVAFKNSVLKSLDETRSLIAASKRPFIAFKPLTDSHRADALLATDAGSKAIWMYRRVEDRANSAVSKFGDTNLRFLRELMEKGPTDRWEARGITAETLSVLRKLDYAQMSAQSAAGVFWYLRNQLFFDQRLDTNPDVLLLKYEMLVRDPERVMRIVCDFLGCRFFEEMIKHIHAQSIGRNDSRLSSEAEKLCGAVTVRLDKSMSRQWRALGANAELLAVNIGR
ncbi:MAG: sulfotransferase [Gammaproteobacteria bacterium]|nr:sulfotransferase [Gammaproteobacteria bacterium]